MAGAIIRDAEEMERFAEALRQFEEEVRQLCDQLQGTLNGASQFMRDADSNRALIKISETLHEIKADLPSTVGMRTKLRRSANLIREAKSALR